jgi:hypothetical protein
MQFNKPASTKEENKNITTLSLKKVKRPVAFAERFSSHATQTELLCAFACCARRYCSTGRRLSKQQRNKTINQ